MFEHVLILYVFGYVIALEKGFISYKLTGSFHPFEINKLDKHLITRGNSFIAIWLEIIYTALKKEICQTGNDQLGE